MTKKKAKLKRLLNKLDPKPKVEIREVVKVVEKIVEKPAKSDLPFLFKVVKKVISLSSNQKKEAAKIQDSIQAIKEELKAEVKKVEEKIPEIPEIPKVDFAPLHT